MTYIGIFNAYAIPASTKRPPLGESLISINSASHSARYFNEAAHNYFWSLKELG